VNTFINALGCPRSCFNFQGIPFFGTFHAFEANIVADAFDLTSADIQLTIDLNSIDTRNKDRDAHLRTADFFDIDKFPSLVFTATA